MNEIAKAKLADFLDKEIGNKEIVIADLIEKVYEFAIKVERNRVLNVVSLHRYRSGDVILPDGKVYQSYNEISMVKRIANGEVYDIDNYGWIDAEGKRVNPELSDSTE